MPVSEAKKRANRKWDLANKEIKSYSTYKSSAKTFIKKYANEKDLILLKELIKEREDNL